MFMSKNKEIIDYNFGVEQDGSLNKMRIGKCAFKVDRRDFIIIDEEYYQASPTPCHRNRIAPLLKYAEKSRLITISYISGVYGVLTCYYLMRFVAPVLDLISPLNESRQRSLIFPGDFYGHSTDHFFLILTVQWSSIMFIGHLVVAFDTLYMTFMLHTCGMFAVLSYRLENLKSQKFKNINVAQADMIHDYLTECVRLHLRCTNYAARLGSAFNIAFFIDLTGGVLLASAAAVKFVTSLNDYNKRTQYGSLYIMQSMRIFINCLPGQLLTDHSTYVNLAAYKNSWYELQGNAKKMLLMLMTRGSKPTQFIVANMFSLNISLFSKVIRTCVSYCTVMLSMQNN
ncbi:odorant receptor 10-like [Prorops nasuta]|uniref:odorant receptor 10-like n=1 Tax=Prorops nasuta TaxID=863751 RepID=UPI0034CF59D8